MYTHTQTHAHAFIHTYWSHLYAHTQTELRLKKRRVTRICRYDESFCKKVKAQRGLHSARNFCQLKSQERFSHERSGARKWESSRMQVRRTVEYSLSRALAHSPWHVCMCVCVCMPGQARGAQRASINMFAAWPQRVECLRRLLYEQHAAMCNMSQWRRHRCSRRPLSPSAHFISLLYSLHKQATSIIISDVCSCSNKQ